MMNLVTRLIRRRQRPQGSGTCDAGYHEGRRTKRSLVYRLQRRTDEVVRCARRYGPPTVRSILDVGTADGLMLSRLSDTFPGASCVGLDLSRELLVCSRDPKVLPVLADAQSLPIRPDRIDLAVATAVIEHVPDPLGVLRQIRASLRPGGLLVLTAPDPFWEHVATLVGHLPDEQHHEVLGLRRLAALCTAAGLAVEEASKFMLSPVGMPAELIVESLVRRIGLNALFANQLVAARRP